MKIDVRKIQCLMADGGIRQKDIAARTGTPYQSLSAVMRRGTCLPVTAGKIAAALGVSTSEIMLEV